MSQAVIIYVSYFCDVLLICWFGTQLTQHVRQMAVLLLLNVLENMFIMCMEPKVKKKLLPSLSNENSSALTGLLH
jgi:hypothetical protein